MRTRTFSRRRNTDLGPRPSQFSQSTTSPFSRPPPSPLPRSDQVLRNVAVLACFAAVALVFVNAFLYTAIIAVGLLAPAWQTFKSLEARDAPGIVELPDADAEDLDDFDDSDDPYDPDYLPTGARRPLAPQHQHAASANAGELQLRNWQTYWVMAALLFGTEALVLRTVVRPLLPTPLYAAWLFSCVAWLTGRGGGNARMAYVGVVRPAFLRVEGAVDKVVEAVMERAEVMSDAAVMQMNGWVAPIARHLEHAAAAGAVQMREEGRGRRRWTRL